MSMPFYVSPEQVMKDRADFARKGIARGRSVVVLQYTDGVLFVAENRSQALHKVSEIYDRIAFAAVGRYNEFENLRIAGVRLADLRGYSYDRRDVTGRGLANAYAQTLGTIFSSGGEKPYEIELFVAEVGDDAERDQIFRLTYEGSVADEHDCAAMGGSAEVVSTYLRDHFRGGLDLSAALQLAVDALSHDGTSEDGRQPVHRRRPARGRSARPHPAAAAQVPPDTGVAPRRAVRLAGECQRHWQRCGRRRLRVAGRRRARVRSTGYRYNRRRPARRGGAVTDAVSESSIDPRAWVQVGPERTLHEGWVGVVGRTYRLPDGRVGQWELRARVFAVAVLGLTDDEDVIVVRQFRPGPDRRMYALPGGLIDDGESPLAAGLRELREETGYTSSTADVVARVQTTANLGARYAVVARGCRLAGPQQLDDFEDIDVEVRSVDELRTMLRAGEMTGSDLAYVALDHAGLL